jgi:regulator of protease activity HflC (stomatin/prohibitin superfamily)
MNTGLVIFLVLVTAALAVLLVIKTVRVIPQARAANVERFGRYRRTLAPGLNFVVPVLDRVKPLIDLREQVVSFENQPVITEDNLVVHIDTVLFFQVTDPRAADYEIVDYATAIEQLSATMLRSVIGSMDLEQTLTSRDRINAMLRGVLDEASGKWGIRVTRVEIKALDPAPSIMDAMEKQYRAQREKRAVILVAEGEKQSAILKSEGQAVAIEKVFKAIHDGKPDPELLAYQYVQALPQVAQSQGSTVWVIPSEVTTALRTLSSAFGNGHEDSGAGREPGAPSPGLRPMPGLSGTLPAGDAGPAGGEPDDGGQPGTGPDPDADARPGTDMPPKAA